MVDRLIQLWEEAASMDETLQLRRRDVPALRRKRVNAKSYSRQYLFSRMINGQVSLFKDFPVHLNDHNGTCTRDELSKLIRTGFPKSQKARVQTGPSRTRCKLKLAEVMRLWEGNRAIIGVTDLHFRGTRFEEALDCSALSNSDILCTDPELIQFIEMMTLVISSKGNVTDSHADDCDGSNHCFVGKKLWLAWDRMEGRSRGFQDVDRDYVAERAAFDMKTFTSLSSAHWFIVKLNETLFLPGNLAHKVVTLEHYIGVGGFHVAFPGYLRSLKRWILYDTLDINQNNLLEKINTAVLKKIYEVRGGPRNWKEHWGLDHMEKAFNNWNKNEDPKTKGLLLKNPAFAAFIQCAFNFTGFDGAQ